MQVLQKSYEDLAKQFGADSVVAKAVFKQLEASRGKIGQTAQSKAVKDLAAADYQLNLHEDTVLKEQAAARQADEAHLISLQKAVDDHQAIMDQQNIVDQEVLDQIKALKIQTAALRKTLPILPAAEDQHGTSQPQVATTPPAPAVLPQPLTYVVKVLQTLPDSMKAIPDVPMTAQQQLQQLQSTMDASITPLLGTTSSQSAPSQFGPAMQDKALTAVREHPYGDVDRQAWEHA